MLRKRSDPSLFRNDKDHLSYDNVCERLAHAMWYVLAHSLLAIYGYLLVPIFRKSVTLNGIDKTIRDLINNTPEQSNGEGDIYFYFHFALHSKDIINDFINRAEKQIEKFHHTTFLDCFLLFNAFHYR